MVVKERSKAIRAPRVRRRLAKVALAICLVAVTLWLGSIGILALSLQGRAAHLLQMAKDPKSLNISAAAQEVHAARGELAILRAELGPLLWVGARMGGDPGAAEPLADAGAESVVAADETLSALAPALTDLKPGSLSISSLPEVLDALLAARPALARSQDHLDRAAAALARIQHPLSPQMERIVARATQLVEIARQGMGGAEMAPDLLARNGSRTYLILVQNSDEIRATGGFITNVGRVEISHGVIISQTFQDSYAVDDFSKYYPDPPKPLLDYMSSEQWVFRDSNWSPDFPTAARDAIRLYQISRPEKIDGVIAINQMTVQMLMAGLEPLQVKGVSEPITVANVSQVLKEAWNAGLASIAGMKSEDERQATRKQFVALAARAAMDQFFTGKVNWMPLAQGLVDAIQQRQLMIYTIGPEADQLGKLGWDGALHSGPGDYLMLVDSDVGFSKVAPLIQRHLDYQVTLLPDGTARSLVTLDYIHRGSEHNIVCSPIVPYNASMTYEKMIDRCFYDYLRLIVPQGSHLRSTDAHPVPGKYLLSGKDVSGMGETLGNEAGHAVFAQFFVLEYGQHLRTQFDYELPQVVEREGIQQRYTLFLQKQSGTDELPVHVTVTVPPEARLISASPPPVRRQGDSLEFNLALSTDREVEVVYADGR